MLENEHMCTVALCPYCLGPNISQRSINLQNVILIADATEKKTEIPFQQLFSRAKFIYVCIFRKASRIYNPIPNDEIALPSTVCSSLAASPIPHLPSPTIPYLCLPCHPLSLHLVIPYPTSLSPTIFVPTPPTLSFFILPYPTQPCHLHRYATLTFHPQTSPLLTVSAYTTIPTYTSLHYTTLHYTTLPFPIRPYTSIPFLILLYPNSSSIPLP